MSFVLLSCPADTHCDATTADHEAGKATRQNYTGDRQECKHGMQ